MNQPLLNNERSKLNKIMYVLGFILFITMCGDVISLALTPFNESRESCATSTMWPFVLTCPLIYAAILKNIKLILSDQCMLTIVTFISVLLTLWGTGELFSINCKSLRQTMLYIMAVIHLMFNYVLISMLCYYNFRVCFCN